jgi:integrase
VSRAEESVKANGVAAFAGLREGEIRGQWWEDDDGKVLKIRRSAWRSHLKYETKTHEDGEDPGVVPIIEPLRVVLDAIKPECASGWMFPNTIGGALDLDDFADRILKPILKANGLKWKGWHANRRALATNLHELGVPDIVIQAILGHEDIRTTQLHQDCAASRQCRHETAGVSGCLYRRRHPAIW